ncbi:MAG: SPOR domain-containing protein [Betaproteobacteria bacterium]|nr:SPOR domain-containing protein [Betaproteobacteria bacterium]MDE2622723.1 SPOR domain-containing protein [Betaproteobacteria bacterium]
MAQREGGGQQGSKTASEGHPFLKGLMIGLILGVSLSAGVALYVTHMPSPFVAHSGQSSTAPDRPPAEMPDISRHGLMNPSPVTSDGAAPPVPANAETAPATANLVPPAAAPAIGPVPATATPVPAPVATVPPVPKVAQPPAQVISYFVQTGAFAKQEEAENQRAHLALLGLDATILSPETVDRQSLYRVRIGPMSSVDEVRTLVATLKNNGLSANIIKVTSVKTKDASVH